MGKATLASPASKIFEFFRLYPKGKLAVHTYYSLTIIIINGKIPL